MSLLVNTNSWSLALRRHGLQIGTDRVLTLERFVMADPRQDRFNIRH